MHKSTQFELFRLFRELFSHSESIFISQLIKFYCLTGLSNLLDEITEKCNLF